MKESEFKLFEEAKTKASWLEDFLGIFDPDMKGKTLLYGYDVDRMTHHVYLNCGDNGPEVVRLVYNHRNEIKSVLRHSLNGPKRELPNLELLVPNKRLYPAACDFAFCDFLCKQGVCLPFTTFVERDVPDDGFYGLTVADD